MARRTRQSQARATPKRASQLASPRLSNWDSARAFLEVARSGSFRSAAQLLHISVNRLRRQVEEFEREAGQTLLTRHVDGVRVTAEGALLIAAVKRMESASFDIARARNLDVSLRGEVRVSATDGLGTFWLAPHLAEFQRAHPGLLVDLRCAMHPADVLRLETDVGIQIVRPTTKDLRIVKLGRMHVMPFATKSYLETYGRPKSLADIPKHRLVLQVSDQLGANEAFARLFPNTPQVGVVSLRVNVSSAQFWAVVHGAGIGVLPTYACVLGAQLEPVDIEGMRFAHDIWLAYHQDAAKIPRVRRLIDWLIEAFVPQKYPWFGDEFIHPRDLPDGVEGLSLVSMFRAMERARQRA